jgi:predicted amidophosphoribosyltransferase
MIILKQLQAVICPACDIEISFNDTECPSCGLVFQIEEE